MRERDKPAYPVPSPVAQEHATGDGLTGLTKYELTVIEMAKGMAALALGQDRTALPCEATDAATAIWDALEGGDD